MGEEREGERQERNIRETKTGTRRERNRETKRLKDRESERTKEIITQTIECR